MRRTPRYLLFLLSTLGLLALLCVPDRRVRRVVRAPDPGLSSLLASVAGEEDPGAAVDSPAPPRPVRGS
jgi:hypothetical protein